MQTYIFTFKFLHILMFDVFGVFFCRANLGRKVKQVPLVCLVPRWVKGVLSVIHACKSLTGIFFLLQGDASDSTELLVRCYLTIKSTCCFYLCEVKVGTVKIDLLGNCIPPSNVQLVWF